VYLGCNSHCAGTSAGAPLSLIKSTRNFAGWVPLMQIREETNADASPRNTPLAVPLATETGLRSPLRSEKDRPFESCGEESGQEGRPEPEASGAAVGTYLSRGLRSRR
jgi:hypothetical protein